MLMEDIFISMDSSRLRLSNAQPKHVELFLNLLAFYSFNENGH